MSISIDLLNTLIAVQEAGSLTAAASRVGVTQPAVHQQLARLADQAGCALYERDGRGIRLTTAGRRLAALGREVALARAHALADIRGHSAPEPVVCAGRGVWSHLVAALPACRPMVADGPGTVRAVQDGTAGLGIAAVSPPTGLHRRPVKSVEEVLVVPTDHPLVGRGPVGWGSLSELPWVLPPLGHPLRQAVEARCGPCRVVVEAHGWDLQQRFVALGAGITLVNSLGPAPPGLVYVPLEHPGSVHYVAFWKQGFDGPSFLEGLGLG